MTRILIVEDDPFLRVWLVRILGSDRYEVDVAKDGWEGLRLLEHQEYSLILLDLVMPIISGFEVLEVLKRERREIPTIIMSGIVLPEVHDYLKPHAKALILSKPLSEESLLPALEYLLDKTGAHRRPSSGN